LHRLIYLHPKASLGQAIFCVASNIKPYYLKEVRGEGVAHSTVQVVTVCSWFPCFVELDCHNDFVLCGLYHIFNLLKFIIEVHQKIFLWAEVLCFVFGTSYMANCAEQREITVNAEFLTITVCGCNCPNLGQSGRSLSHH
jgi:hypothetical protein